MNELSAPRAPRRLVVDVDSPSGRHPMALPVNARIDDLLPGLVEACEGRSESAGWRLAPLGEEPLAGEATLRESGLFSGAVLVLIPPVELRAAMADGPNWAERLPKAVGRIRAGLRQPTRPQSIHRMGDTDYLRLLDDAIVASPSGASMVVAVMSADPGAGTTTVTALLATLLSRLRSELLVAVDANPGSGALSHWLIPDSGLSSEAYRSLFDENLTPEQVRVTLVAAAPGLTVLPGPLDPSSAIFVTERDWRRLIQHLRHLHNTVLIDCGAGFQRAACRAALDAADHVVLVSRPQAGDSDRAAPAAETLRRKGQTVVRVANQALRRARSTLSAAGVQQVTIPYEAQPAARLKTRAFDWTEAPPSWQESVRELAAVLAGSRASTEV